MKTLILILLFPVCSFGQNHIEVRGQAVVKVVPDLIYLRIRLAEKEKYATDLVAKERRMFGALGKIGVQSKDIVVKDLASNFRSPAFTFDNVVLSKEYVVCLHDVKKANDVISALDDLKISNIRVDHLDHTNLPEFRKECGVKAMVTAKSKAETLSSSINQSIGKAVHIEELANTLPVTKEETNVVFKAEMSASPGWFVSELAFDEIKLECTILARFELNDGSHTSGD